MCYQLADLLHVVSLAESRAHDRYEKIEDKTAGVALVKFLCWLKYHLPSYWDFSGKS